MQNMSDIKTIRKEYNEILQQLSDPELISDWERFQELSQKKKKLEKVINIEDEIKDIEGRIEENRSISALENDSELIALAEEELNNFLESKKELEKELEKFLKGEDSPCYQSVIIEIRAGTGGDEAALFAGDLFRMYSRYAESKNWKQRVLNSHKTEIGGFKEIVFELLNSNAFSEMQYESGVHRVQRIPETEKAGRVHTSTATVAVLPKAKKTEISVKPEDLKIDVYRSSGPGGQNVNKRETAVRVTHLPTGIVVASQNERNQLQNKENAIAILEARLLERKREEQTKKLGGERKTQIGGAKRSEKIRTYNFPQDRLTDHRIKKSWYGLENILSGQMGPIIKTLQESGNSDGSGN